MNLRCVGPGGCVAGGGWPSGTTCAGSMPPVHVAVTVFQSPSMNLLPLECTRAALLAAGLPCLSLRFCLHMLRLREPNEVRQTVADAR